MVYIVKLIENINGKNVVKKEISGGNRVVTLLLNDAFSDSTTFGIWTYIDGYRVLDVLERLREAFEYLSTNPNEYYKILMSNPQLLLKEDTDIVKEYNNAVKFLHEIIIACEENNKAEIEIEEI